MSIVYYSILMAILVVALMGIGHVLLKKNRNPLMVILLLVGLVMITVTVSYAAQSVHLRKEMIAWH